MSIRLLRNYRICMFNLLSLQLAPYSVIILRCLFNNLHILKKLRHSSRCILSWELSYVQGVMFGHLYRRCILSWELSYVQGVMISHLYSRCIVSWELSYVQGVTFGGTLVVLITPFNTRSVVEFQ